MLVGTVTVEPQLVGDMSAAIKSCTLLHPTKNLIRFVKAGEQTKQVPKETVGLLSSARDWQLIVDLGKQLKFPAHISATSLRPDVIIL